MEKTRPLSLADFQHESPLDDTATYSHRDPNSLSESGQTARQLREARDRFAKKIPVEGNKLCYSADRSAVLDVYRQALASIDAQNHTLILSEATLKVKVILGIRKAAPHDVVFTTGGVLLKPLEPQYAEPRIQSRDDTNGYRATWRLIAWRKEGWPTDYPKAAVDRELQILKVFPNRGEGEAESWRRITKWNDEDWGDEVNANPAPGDQQESNDQNVD